MILAITIPPPIPLLALGLLVAWLLAVAWTRRRLIAPPRRTYGWAVSRGIPGDPGELPSPRPFTSFTFHGSSEGTGAPPTLHAWDIQGQDPAGPVIVLSHGWGESRVTMLERITHISAFASRIVAWDLPGHGDSQGRCNLGATESRDLSNLLDVIQARGNGPPDAAIVLYGFSLGAGVSVVAALEPRARVDALILEAPYRLPDTPARAVLRGLGLPAGVTLDFALSLIGTQVGAGPLWKGFGRARHAARLPPSTRVLVIQGEHDTISPSADGIEIARACGGTFVPIHGTGHLDNWQDAGLEQCRSAMQPFLASLAKSGPR